MNHANKLFITRIPSETPLEIIKELFERFGKVRVLEIFPSRDTPGTLYCYLKYATKEQAIIALKDLNNIFRFPGSQRPIEMFFAESVRSNKKLFSTFSEEEKRKLIKEHTIESDALESNQDYLGVEYYYEWPSPFGVYYYNSRTGVSQWEKPEGNNIIVVPYKGEKLESQIKIEKSDKIILILFRNIPSILSNENLFDFCRNYGSPISASIAEENILEQFSVVKRHPNENIGLIYFEDQIIADEFYGKVHGRNLYGILIRGNS